MVRMKLIAVIAAVGAFALVGCSKNTGGTAAPATTPGTTSAAATSAAATSAAATSSAAGATSSAAGGGSSEEGSSATETSEQSTITVGGNVDAQTGTWFSAFCTGMSPLLDAVSGGAVPTGGADMQSTMVKEFGTLGDAMTNTANALKPLPPPTFANGQQFATDVVTSLSQAGPEMKTAASDIQAVDPTDASALEAAIEKAGDTLQNSLSALDKYDLDENTQNAMKNIPACAAFAAEAGGDSGSTTTG